MKTYDDVDYAEEWTSLSNDSTPFGGNNPWKYRSTLELDGTPIWGKMDAYSGGGYVANLGLDIESALNTTLYLKEKRWLDRLSRALFVEFNLYNPNVNLFAVVNLLLEFPNTGGVLTTPLIQTLRLYYYVGPAAFFRVILEVIFAIFTIYFIIREAKKFSKEKWAYFRSFWNIMEFLTLFGSVSAVVLYGCHYAFTRVTLKKFQKNPGRSPCHIIFPLILTESWCLFPGAFTNFQYILLWDSAFTYCCGILVFLSMIKTLRLLRFNRKVAELSSVLSVSVRPLLCFFLSFIILYLAFAQFAMLVFGRHVEAYCHLTSALETLFSMMLMNFSFNDLQDTNPVLGPVFFLLYVVVLALVVINVLVAILNESYNKVKSEGIETETDYKMVDYILAQFKTLVGFSNRSRPGKYSFGMEICRSSAHVHKNVLYLYKMFDSTGYSYYKH